MARGYLEDEPVRAGNTSTITLERVRCLRESKFAIYVRREASAHEAVVGPRRFWVPSSVVHDDSEVYKEKDFGKLIIKEWWARKEGIEP